MLQNITKIKRWAMGVIGTLFLGIAITPTVSCFAEESKGLALSPLNQMVVLNAEERYTGSFYISNPEANGYDFTYQISTSPFYVDENYIIYYEEYGDFSQMVNWISLDDEKGVLKPGEVKEIHYTIDVPSDVPAGGQYAAIIVNGIPNADNSSNETNSEVGTQLTETMSMAYIIYAEISGTTVRQGEISSIDVPSFLLSGDITGSATIKNTGNIHGIAKYTLQVFPLFSNEEIYTNEENPDQRSILPDRTLYNETAWDKTPDIGIFNVVYTVEFEGVTAQVSKMVIKCPIWLLFIIFFIIAAVIIWLVMRARGRKKSARKSD